MIKSTMNPDLFYQPTGVACHRVCARTMLGMAVVTSVLLSTSAYAGRFTLGDEVKGTWNNTLKYSLGVRTSDPNPYALANTNTDDTDNNFEKGSLMMNRGDWLSELTMRYRNFGLSLSGSVLYDDVYNRTNDNDSTTNNAYSVAADEFTDDTKNWSGKRAELLNAYVSGQFTPGDIPVSVRIGRHTMLWGESLFFTDNGIAATMAPVDAAKALSVPNTKAQELFLPVNQITASALLGGGWTVEGFYQLEWEKTRIPPVGSYMSSADMLDFGGERIDAGSGAYFYRSHDNEPNAPQFGVSARWRPADLNLDLGFYAVRYNDKTPQVRVTPSGGFDPATGSIGTYNLEYQENIKLYGISSNSTFGQLNVGSEISYRQGIPLGELNVLGDTLHAQMSAIYVGRAGALWDAFSVAGEVAGHQLVKATRNGDQRPDEDDDHALGMRGVMTMDYYQLAPSLDVQVPIGLGYNVAGKSPVAGAFNNYGSHQGGDISLGITGIYQYDWKAGLNYTHFFGAEDQNYYSGRDFLMVSITRTFQ
tara:strand:- start:2757 stop:4355 length:1599 start_codon:yes stop_codon:yes gene_type:complete